MVNSKYMEFDKVGDTGKTEIFNILSKSSGYILGQIKWYGKWRQYCFFPSAQCLFNVGCMDDITKFIKILMEDRRINKRNILMEDRIINKRNYAIKPKT